MGSRGTREIEGSPAGLGAVFFTFHKPLKCTIKKIEIEYKEDDTANMVGETSFMKLDTEDKTLFKTELVYANFYIWDNLRNNAKLKKSMTLETINRYDGL